MSEHVSGNRTGRGIEAAGEQVDHLVVVGASLAGLRAVETARKVGYLGAVTLVGAEPHLPYNRPALSKSILEPPGTADARAEMELLRPCEDLAADLDIDLLLDTPATGLHPDTRRLAVGARTIAYDRLIIATGAAARHLSPSLPGANARGVFTLRTIDDARSLSASLNSAADVVVIGAGFIGAEVASAARARGARVTIVERLPVPLVRSVGEQAGAILTDLHRRSGTDLRCGVEVAAILTRPVTDTGDGEDRVCAVQLADGTILAADVVVVGVGAVPATEWLADSGIDRHHDGGIICDTDLSTNLAGVYAAGDVAHAPNMLFDGEMLRPEHWTNAAEQGALAARNALGLTTTPAPTVPYFWSDIYGNRIQFVGTPGADHIETLAADTTAPIVLYRRGDRVVGALVVNRPREVMKLRRRIAERASFTDALDFARQVTGESMPSPSTHGADTRATERIQR